MAKNGGYQIIDFNGQAPATMDVTFVESCLNRGKPVWINNLVVDGETYCGVGSLKKTLTSIIIAIASINIIIALSDGSTTYEEIGGKDIVLLNVTLDDSGELSDGDKAKLTDALSQDKPIILHTPTYFNTNQGEWKDSGDTFIPLTKINNVLSGIVSLETATTLTIIEILSNGTYNLSSATLTTI